MDDSYDSYVWIIEPNIPFIDLTTDDSQKLPNRTTPSTAHSSSATTTTQRLAEVPSLHFTQPELKQSEMTEADTQQAVALSDGRIMVLAEYKQLLVENKQQNSAVAAAASTAVNQERAEVPASVKYATTTEQVQKPKPSRVENRGGRSRRNNSPPTNVNSNSVQYSLQNITNTVQQSQRFVPQQQIKLLSQVQQKQNIPAVTPKTPTPEPPMEVEIPRYVPGLLAICNYCAYRSANSNKCLRCRYKLPEDVKTRPALNSSDTNGKKSDQAQQKQNIPAVIPKAPTIEPPTEVEIPGYVPGLLAICNYCGYRSANSNKCLRCRYKLPEDVKTRPALNSSDTNGKKPDQAQQKQNIPAIIPKAPTIEPPTEVEIPGYVPGLLAICNYCGYRSANSNKCLRCRYKLPEDVKTRPALNSSDTNGKKPDQAQQKQNIPAVTPKAPTIEPPMEVEIPGYVPGLLAICNYCGYRSANFNSCLRCRYKFPEDVKTRPALNSSDTNGKKPDQAQQKQNIPAVTPKAPTQKPPTEVEIPGNVPGLLAICNYCGYRSANFNSCLRCRYKLLEHVKTRPALNSSDTNGKKPDQAQQKQNIPAVIPKAPTIEPPMEVEIPGYVPGLLAICNYCGYRSANFNSCLRCRYKLPEDVKTRPALNSCDTNGKKPDQAQQKQNIPAVIPKAPTIEPPMEVEIPGYVPGLLAICSYCGYRSTNINKRLRCRYKLPDEVKTRPALNSSDTNGKKPDQAQQKLNIPAVIPKAPTIEPPMEVEIPGYVPGLLAICSYCGYRSTNINKRLRCRYKLPDEVKTRPALNSSDTNGKKPDQAQQKQNIPAVIPKAPTIEPPMEVEIPGYVPGLLAICNYCGYRSANFNSCLRCRYKLPEDVKTRPALNSCDTNGKKPDQAQQKQNIPAVIPKAPTIEPPMEVEIPGYVPGLLAICNYCGYRSANFNSCLRCRYKLPEHVKTRPALNSSDTNGKKPDQAQQKQNIPAVIPKVPTIEPPTEVEIPRYVSGLLAICNYCGYRSANFNKCLRCRYKLPEDVKTRPALNSSDSNGKKPDQAQQKLNIPAVIPKAPTIEPPMEVEIPGYVPGLLAICNYCGYRSANFNKCLRCRYKLPEDVKTRPALNSSDTNGKKPDQAQQKQNIPAVIPKAPTIEPPTEVEIPRYVSGLLAICNYCGYRSANFNKCLRCRYKLPEDVKTRPALNSSDTNGKKPDQAQQKQNIPAVTPKAPTPEPPMEVQIPGNVPGLLAICNYCGYRSGNFNKRLRCRYKFPEDVKTRPALNSSDTNGKKPDQAQQKQNIPAVTPKAPTPEPPMEVQIPGNVPGLLAICNYCGYRSANFNKRLRCRYKLPEDVKTRPALNSSDTNGKKPDVLTSVQALLVKKTPIKGSNCPTCKVTNGAANKKKKAKIIEPEPVVLTLISDEEEEYLTDNKLSERRNLFPSHPRGHRRSTRKSEKNNTSAQSPPRKASQDSGSIGLSQEHAPLDFDVSGSSKVENDDKVSNNIVRGTKRKNSSSIESDENSDRGDSK